MPTMCVPLPPPPALHSAPLSRLAGLCHVWRGRLNGRWYSALGAWALGLMLWLPLPAQALACSPYMGQASLNEVRIGHSNALDAKNQIEIYNSGNVDPSVWGTWQLIVYYKDGSKTAVKQGGYYLATNMASTGQFINNNSNKKLFLRNRSGKSVDIALVDANGDFINYLAINAQIQTLPGCLGTPKVVNASSTSDTTGDIERLPDGGTWPGAVAATSAHSIGTTNACTAGGSDLIVTNSANIATPVVNLTTVTYTVSVTNKSCTNTVGSIVLTDTGIATSNFSGLAKSVSQGSTSQGANALTWTVGTLVAGATATLTVSGKPLNLGTLTTTAALTAPSSGLVNTSDDSETETITVLAYNYVGFDLAAATLTEGSNLAYSASLSSAVAPSSSITVSYTVSGTAGPGDTNLPSSGTVIIDPTDPNSPSSTSIDFTITNDTIGEVTKMITLTLTAVSSSDNTVKLDPAAKVMNITLIDDDIDHYELSLPSTSLSCLPTTVSVTACADTSSPCSSPHTLATGKTATLTTSGATLAATTLTFDASGVATTTLNYPQAADATAVSVTLSGEQQAAANPRKCCPNGSSCAAANSCATVFSSAGFIIAAAANGTATTLPTQTAGTASGMFYLRAVKTSTSTKACEAALSGANTVNWALQCNNPSTCSTGTGSSLMVLNGGSPTSLLGNPNSGVTGSTAVAMTFDANGNAPFSLTFSDVGLVRLWASKTVNAAGLSGSSNAFVSRPAGLLISALAQTAAPQLINPAAASASDAVFVKAGESFSASVTATTSTGAAAPNFGKESPAEAVLLTPLLVLPAGGQLGTLANASIAGGSFVNGAATVNNLAWDEVGILKLTASIADGDYLGSGPLAGATSGNIGRFVPDHLAITAGTPAAACSNAFSYFGQDGFSTPFMLRAENSGNAVTQNYTGSFARLGLSSWAGYGFTAAGLPAGSALAASSTAPTGSWSLGWANVLARHQVSRPNVVSAETFVTVKAAPVDADGVTLSGAATAVAAATPLRSGRLRLSNAFGSANAALQVPVVAEYWSGSNWVLNSADSCSTLGSASVALSNPRSATGAASSASSSAGSLSISNGSGVISLTAPTPSGSSLSLDIALNLGSTSADQSCQANHPTTTGAAKPWLRAQNGACASTADRDPAARASFGIFSPETKRTVHVREVF